MKEAISAKQIEGIKALIKYPTVKEAADASSTPIRTLERWLTQPEFLDALHMFQKDSFQDAGIKIISSMTEATESIIDVMRNPTQPGANMKLKAASRLLEQGAKLHDTLELEERVLKLEEKARFKNTTRIARLEDFYCKKIVDNYMQSDAYQPMASINQHELDYFDHILESDPSQIDLLTFEERVKYDQAFANRLRVDQLMKNKEDQLRTAIKKEMKLKKEKNGGKQDSNLVKIPVTSEKSANESNPVTPDEHTENESPEPSSDV